MNLTKRDLVERQNYTLEQKIDHSLGSIENFYNHYDGKVYISFSGGKDSTVLLHLVRRLYPEAKAVFVDSGLEYPEIREFVKTVDNVDSLIPNKNFKYVLEKHGFPVISKKISMGVNRWRVTKSEVQKRLRLFGGINPSSGKKQYPSVTKKWHFLTKAPFKISEKCCDVLKKEPLKNFEKRTGLKPIIGTMAEESTLRVIEYLKHGCNAFDKKLPQSPTISHNLPL